MKTALVALLLALSFGCIVDMGTTTTVKSNDDHTPVPDKYPPADHPPELVDSDAPGCQRAQSLDLNLYYCAKDEHWFRYALNRWYLAFAWDGNWFPVGDNDLPRSLAKITPAPEEVKKSREDRLKQLEQQMEDLDKQEPAKSGN